MTDLEIFLLRPPFVENAPLRRILSYFAVSCWDLWPHVVSCPLHDLDGGIDAYAGDSSALGNDLVL